jgi:predicted nucleic acid-binding protein
VNGNRVLADTNTLVYFFNNHPKAIKALDGNQIFISAVTEIELLSYQGLDDESILAIKEFFTDCSIVEIIPKIKDLTIDLKRTKKVKLPDAIIAATAQFLKVELITFDKGFANIPNLDLILLEF